MTAIFHSRRPTFPHARSIHDRNRSKKLPNTKENEQPSPRPPPVPPRSLGSPNPAKPPPSIRRMRSLPPPRSRKPAHSHPQVPRRSSRSPNAPKHRAPSLPAFRTRTPEPQPPPRRAPPAKVKIPKIEFHPPTPAFVTAQGTIVESPTGSDSGWIQSDAGMFQFDQQSLRDSRSRLADGPVACGQICTFTSPDGHTASNIRESMTVPKDRIDASLDAKGRTQYDAPVYVLDTPLAVRGTDVHNEYFEGRCRSDVTDSKLQEGLEITLNAFVNTEGGMIFIGVDRHTQLITGREMTSHEQERIRTLIDRIAKSWKPALPYESCVSVLFVPVCRRSGMICRDQFVVRIDVQGPLHKENGDAITFSFKRNNEAFVRQLSWNVLLSRFNRNSVF